MTLSRDEIVVLRAAPGHLLGTYAEDNPVYSLIERGLLEARYTGIMSFLFACKTIVMTDAGRKALDDAHVS